MSYSVIRTDGHLIVVEDGVLNTTDTSIGLVGINYQDYAAAIATTQVHLLQNFAAGAPPSNMLPGQLWYDTGNKLLYVNKAVADGIPELTVLSDAGTQGESNTASNGVAQGGVGLVMPKEGVDLPFKTLVAGNGVTLDGSDPNSIVITSTGGSGGGGTFLSLTDTPTNYVGKAGQVATVNPTADGLIFSPGGGQGENLGFGTPVYVDASSPPQYRTLIGGTGINIISDSDTVEITATGGGSGGGGLDDLSDVTLTNPITSGQLLIASGTGQWLNSDEIGTDLTVQGNLSVGTIDGYTLPGSDGTNGQVLITLGGYLGLAWADQSGGSGGGISDAPIDGATYARKNASWTVIAGSTEEVAIVLGAPDTGSTLITVTSVLIEPDQTSTLITASWPSVVEAVDYLLQIDQYDPTGSFVVATDIPIVPDGGGITQYEFTGFVATKYEFRLQPRNGQGFVGVWTDPKVEHVTQADMVPPAAPTSLLADAGLGAVSTTWTNPADLDYDYTNVYVSSVDSTFPTENEKVAETRVGNYFVGGLSVGVTYYFWTAAVDTSGNISDFSNKVSAVPIGSVLDIPPNSITGLELADAAVLAANIATGAVEETKIEDDAITTGKIRANTIVAGHMTANSITAPSITAGVIGTDKLAANAVIASKIAANTITSNQIQSNSIIGDDLQMNTIQVGTPNSSGGTVTIKGGYIQGSHIKANTVTSTNIITSQLIAGGNITIADGSISTPQLAAGSVTAGKIAAGSVTATAIGTNQIIASTANVKNGIIRTAHIQNGNITNAKIGNAAVQTLNIGGNAVTVPLGIYSGTDVTLNYGSWKVLTWVNVNWGASISTRPTKVLVNGLVNCGNDGKDRSLIIRVTRSTGTSAGGSAGGTVGISIRSNWSGASTTSYMFGAPAAQTENYKIEAMIDSNGAPTNRKATYYGINIVGAKR